MVLPGATLATQNPVPAYMASLPKRYGLASIRPGLEKLVRGMRQAVNASGDEVDCRAIRYLACRGLT